MRVFVVRGLLVHNMDHPAMQEPIDDKSMGSSDAESSLFTEGASFGKCIGMDIALYNPVGQPLD